VEMSGLGGGSTGNTVGGALVRQRTVMP